MSNSSLLYVIEPSILSKSSVGTYNFQEKVNVCDEDISKSFLTIRSQSNLKIGKELGTLLMYKDLRTSGRYDIQFANNSRHSSRTNDSVPVPKKGLRDKEETSAENGGMKKQKLEGGSGRKQSSNECE